MTPRKPQTIRPTNRAARRHPEAIPASVPAVPLPLDAAQRLGIQAAVSAVNKARKENADTEAKLAAIIKMSEEVFVAVGLDPKANYPMDDEGNIYPAVKEGTQK